jgi:DeoR/GlpR family transcriptional regulator of sugar metabolism
VDHTADRPETPIAEVLAREGPATCPELAERLDLHPVTVRRECDRLQRQGDVRRTTGGAYVLHGSDSVSVRLASD